MWDPRNATVRRRLMCAVALGAALAAGPVWAQTRPFRIPSLPASSGVTEFARQAGVQILVSAEAAQGKHTAAVSGSMSVTEALTSLLVGTGLVVTANDGRTITLAPAPVRLIRTRWASEPASAFAVAASEGEAIATADSEVAPKELEEVLVTGTRLQASGFTAPTPVTVVGGAQFEARASASVFETLREIPSFRGSSGPSANSTGAQSASKANLDLRGLGSNRTLVLINGRRHVADGTGNVFDTNLIPTSLIERVDIVTGGASAAYGSDAVSGAVNFVMKNRLEGFNLDLRYGISQRGDNVEYNPSFAWGRSFLDGRLHVVVGGDMTENHGTGTMYTRDWGKAEPGMLSISASAIPNRVALGLPANIITNHVETSAYNAGGLITSGPLKGIAFLDNGQIAQFQYGAVNGGTEMIGTGNYGSVENPDQFLRAAYERSAAMARVEFDVTDDTMAFGQVMYGALHTHGRSFGARVPNFSNYPVLITNPFLPAAVVTAMKANNLTTFNYSASRHDDLGSIESHNRTETVQAEAGLRGKVFGDWSWDIGAGAGKATFAPNIHNTPRTADFFESAYVVAGPNGVPICGPVATNPYFNAQPAVVKAQLIANLSPGCVPYNIFGTNKAANAGALAYFNSASQADFEFRQYTASANLAGSPITLPAGPLSVAAGLEFRKEKLSSVNCPDCQKGALMNQNYSLFSGDVTIKEVYGELGIPVLKDMPFVKSLDLNAAGRRTDYSSSGAVSTWKVGATWQIDEMLRLRGTRSHDIRAPNINELYNPGSEGNPNIVNKTNGVSGFIKSNTIGNPDLSPETADTFSAGLVFQPTWGWAQGFRASIDYYNIKIDKVIGTLAVQDILDAVLVNKDPAYEKYVVRDSTPLGISRVNVPQLNLNAMRTDGIDIEVVYRVPLESYNLPGTLDLRALGTYIDDARTISAGRDIDGAGTSGSPTWSWNGSATWRLNGLTTGLMVRYTSKIKFSATLVGPNDPNYSIASANSINQNLWPEALYYNGFVRYDLEPLTGRKIQVYANVDNILDKQPPIVAISIGGSAYDLIGRAFKVGLHFSY
jgi:iron complex outermembrane receptor protein